MKSIAWAILVASCLIIATWYEISGHQVSDAGKRVLGSFIMLSIAGFLISLIP